MSYRPPPAQVVRRRSILDRLVPGIGPGQVVIFGVALLIWARGVRARLAAEGGLYLSQDAEWYVDRAEAFAGGDWLWTGVTTGLTTHYPPGYPLVLRAMDAVPGLDLRSGVLLLHGLCVLALTVALARIAVALSPRRDTAMANMFIKRRRRGGLVIEGMGRLSERAEAGGLLPAAIAAAFICGPAVIDHTAAPLTETIFYTCWAWTLALLLDPRREGSARLIPLILLGSVAVLHRYIALPLVGAVALWLLIEQRFPASPTGEAADGRLPEVRTPDPSRTPGGELSARTPFSVVGSRFRSGLRTAAARGHEPARPVPSSGVTLSWSNRPLLPAGVVRAGLYLIGTVGPLLIWSSLMGGIDQDRKPGELETLEAMRDSLVMFGARLLHLPAGRVGGVTGRVQLKAPFGLDVGAETIALVVATAVLLLAVVIAGCALFRSGSPAARIALISLVAAVPAVWFRTRIGHIYIDRYWALTPTFLLMAVAARPGVTRFERVLCWTVTLGAVLWSTSRYGADLSAVADVFEI